MDSTSILPSAVNKVGRATGLAVLCSAVLLAVTGSVTAQTAPAPAAVAGAGTATVLPRVAPAAAPKVFKPAWSELSVPQKVALAPLAGEWDRLEPLRKQKWLDIANRFAAMKADEQARVHEKMREWVRMTPDERRLVRENYTRAKKLDVPQKSEQWEKYQQLPEEQKQKLAAEAAAKSKKQLTNLPTPTQASVKTVAPIVKNGQPPCPAGSVRNPALAAAVTPPAPGSAAVPACVAAAVPATAAATPTGAPALPPANANAR